MLLRLFSPVARIRRYVEWGTNYNDLEKLAACICRVVQVVMVMFFVYISGYWHIVIQMENKVSSLVSCCKTEIRN